VGRQKFLTWDADAGGGGTLYSKREINEEIEKVLVRGGEKTGNLSSRERNQGSMKKRERLGTKGARLRGEKVII